MEPQRPVSWTAADTPEGKEVAVDRGPVVSIACDLSAGVGRRGIRVPPTCPVGVQRVPIRTAIRQKGVYDLKEEHRCGQVWTCVDR